MSTSAEASNKQTSASSELAHTSLAWTSCMMKEWDWEINTDIKAGKVPLQMQWRQSCHWTYCGRKRWYCPCLLLCTGSLFPLILIKHTQFESPALSWQGYDTSETHKSHLPCSFTNLHVVHGNWCLFIILGAIQSVNWKCKWEERTLTSRKELHVGGSRGVFSTQSNMHWYKVSKF